MIDDVFIDSKAELIQSNLTFLQEQKLKQASGESVHPQGLHPPTPSQV